MAGSTQDTGVKDVPKELVEQAKKLSITDGMDQLKVEGKNKVKDKKSKKKGKALNEITPEYIAEMRAKREAAKIAKKEALIAQGIDPKLPADLRFIKRPMLAVPRDSSGQSTREVCPISIMTYNCLAQALIRRTLFPTSGNAVKWFKRSQVLLNEFKYYNVDVLCLQEIDTVQYKSFWKMEFTKLGYMCQFHFNPTKNHGVLIAWKEDLFDMTDKMLIDYDKETTGAIEPRTTTKNVGMLLSLKFKKKVLEKYPDTKVSGIIIGTTHLFWHPFGTYERTRQCYIVLKKVKEFQNRINVLQNEKDGDNSHWPAFFCGDFNSQPFDAPYLSITSKPVEYTGRAKTVIECSTSFTFSKLRDGDEGEGEEGGNIEKFGKGQPETPVPESFSGNEEQKQLCENMKTLHNDIDMRAISLYSIAYSKVHPENSGLDNKRNEPEISNWAHAWRGLLDYLYYVTSWDGCDCTKIDELSTFEQNYGVQVLELLRIPPAKEMTEHGQPHEGEYPSDHLCMIVKLGIIM
ncbi:RNA exonuclease [Kluyveromyces lactis]|uniref:KLLA0C06248p n=1 Tax=Kluyveromyces lactis (strain ATCC 8585 / CBS 2359 / DSM 70799 / NBRC 1267 / NRRL Y-1140 / WM37) TaxID=284590 RepID=Q6CUB3_KLULA|nr:uncharacterized protein KLLA0_C06248g [Kluyveromyces lactis]CAH01327.1 KLLA0C06248p [Kluyveromyces lactis]|eukprot:XP_452476.1 uncharacterized protein KLLA0_C06248g [Kluyveromyces lactis]